MSKVVNFKIGTTVYAVPFGSLEISRPLQGKRPISFYVFCQKLSLQGVPPVYMLGGATLNYSSIEEVKNSTRLKMRNLYLL